MYPQIDFFFTQICQSPSAFGCCTLYQEPALHPLHPSVLRSNAPNSAHPRKSFYKYLSHHTHPQTVLTKVDGYPLLIIIVIYFLLRGQYYLFPYLLSISLTKYDNTYKKGSCLPSSLEHNCTSYG